MSQRDATSRLGALQMAGLAGLMRWLGLVPWAVLLLALFIQWSDFGRVLEGQRNKVFDFYQNAAPRPYVDAGVRYVDVDEESIRRIGQWPWPRTTLATLTRNLQESRVGVISWDMVFPEADRTSPPSIARSLPDAAEWQATREQLETLPDNDAVFAQALKETPSVLGFILGPTDTGRTPILKAGVARVGDPDSSLLEAVQGFSGATVPLDLLQQAAPGTGAFNTITDDDGIIRRVPLFVGLVNRGKSEIYPGLALETLRVAIGSATGTYPTIQVKMAGGGGELAVGQPNRVISVKVGPVVIPSTSDGQMWVHFTTDQPSRRIPAWKVLEEPGSLGDLEGAAIFIGTSAAGLLDLRTTPMRIDTPGVELHVQALEQMLLGHYLGRPDWSDGAELGFALTLGLLVLLSINRVPVFWIAGVAVVAVVFAVSVSWWAFTEQRWLLDPVAPSLTIALVFAAASIVKFMRTETERRTVRNAFAQYLPPDVVNEIAQDPSKLRLGGDTRELSIMFCDIRGFTPIAESFRSDPQGLTRLINRVLTPLSRDVLQHQGTIDKYIGDCVMAFWHAPLDIEDHPTHACDCALDMQDSLTALNNELMAEGFFLKHAVSPIAVTVGINTGTCVVGNMGSDLRFDYSALGDAVNLSARIQSFAGNYGFALVVGEDTATRVSGKFALLELDFLAVKGRAAPTYLYALMGHAHVAETKAFQDLDTTLKVLLAAFRSRDWDGARAAIAQGRALPGAPAEIFDTYEERIQHFLYEPPPEGWDGSWSARDK
ncbi:MAG: CHASE2 domain-containing protein [Alphaproteobacteria bacterium]